MIPTLAGFAVVLVLLLFATQVAFDLYARSAVTAAALDAVRSVADDHQAASYTGNPDAASAAAAQAQARAMSALGRYGKVTSFQWAFLPDPGQPQVVSLRVRFDLRGGRLSLVGPLTLPGLNRFDRTVRARVERVVCPPGQTCTVVR